jgi:hypothetical protein
MVKGGVATRHKRSFTMSKQKVVVTTEAEPVVLYTLSEKAMEKIASEGFTLQRTEKVHGKGKAWRTEASVSRGNTRIAALAVVLQECGEKFTREECMAALAIAKKADPITSWTPAARWKTFTKNGMYFQQV